ncbi:hypothetical protein TNCV_2895741 [Trichonephila clavipes]|nr:hypothetical protein TNCV_2895741 [Trichonephila clavipes]
MAYIRVEAQGLKNFKTSLSMPLPTTIHHHFPFSQKAAVGQVGLCLGGAFLAITSGWNIGWIRQHANPFLQQQGEVKKMAQRIEFQAAKKCGKEKEIVC